MDDQDLQAQSIKKYDHKSQVLRSVFGERNIWTKLKIPKNEEQGSKELDDHNNGFRAINNIRVCRFCSKVFSSGKALGGHMRIHVESNKDLVLKKKLKSHQSIKFKKVQERVVDLVKEKKKTNIDEKQTCIICGKDFPSEKSLFGHMRCHPERDWRGIQPPTMARKTPSSSSDDDDDDWKVDYPVDSVVDLTKSLKGWSVTAKRGRKLVDTSASEISSLDLDIDDQLREAVNDLMMLAQGDTFKTDLTNRQKVNDHFEVVNSTSQAGVGDIKQFVEEDETCIEELNSFSVENLDDENYLETSDMILKNKKRRKRVLKLSDLEVVTNATIMNDKYHCNTCDKYFTTYQALGGHRSGHKRCKIWEEEDEEEFSNDPIVQLTDEAKESEASNVCRRSVLIDFDLNEVPPSEDEAGIESQLVASVVN